ncbi:ABC transporter substrate-binding protein [Frankia sp. QA3]|uniref:ABC transporter substrate-binding protein n=1 Tax=Frankia sp. QA3 TaxID=710111 RepID=UPI000269BB65|nr:ABC transporter substrate-binding protein [Frankia sp. QA3]EIV92620.1 ABC-type dipeptide transport system, periplasmic component [Frankia sp. QA3]
MIRRLRAVAALAAATVAAGVIGACGSSDSSSATRSITVLQGFSPTSFDPATIASVGSSDGSVGYAVYDNLFRIEYSTGRFIPRLATSLTPNEDATVWTLQIRAGVKFSDGTPLNAEAVRFNWDRIRDDPALASPCYSTIKGLKSYQVTAAQTLVIRLPERRSAFPQQLFSSGQVRGGFCTNVASPTALRRYAARYGTSPETTVGAGPFVLKEWVRGDHLTLSRNAGYWDAPRPYLDGITVKPSPDITTSVNAVLTGAAALAGVGAWTPDVARYVQAGYKYHVELTSGAAMVTFNPARAPLDDVRVRTALTLATDLEEINRKNFAGLVTPARTWFSEKSVFYDAEAAKASTQRTNDLAAAQRLIDEYVAEKGGPVKVTLLASPTNLPLFTTLQQQWHRLHDVKAEIEQVTGQVWNQRNIQGQAQIALNSLGANDVEGMIASFGAGGAQNYFKWSDPQLEKILMQARPENNQSEQRKLMTSAAQRLSELHWFVMLYRPGQETLVGKDLTNIVLHDPSQVDLAQLQLKN